MKTHPRKVRPHATPRPAKEARPERKPAATNRYLAQKATALRFDYAQIPEAHREQVQRAALEIQRWQRDTIALGQTLLAVKELMPHRQFLEWLEIEFGLKERSIQSMMNVARVYGEPEKAQRVALLSAGALYELAAPSTPPEARDAIEALLEIPGAIPSRAEVKRVIDGFKPPKPRKQLPPPAEPEPPSIEAEYTVFTTPAALTFADWLQACPADLTLREQMAILALAKTTALRALGDHPGLYNAVYGALPTWSALIHRIEQELKHDQ